MALCCKAELEPPQLLIPHTHLQLSLSFRWWRISEFKRDRDQQMAKKMAAAIVVLLLTFEATFAGRSRFSNSLNITGCPKKMSDSDFLVIAASAA